jgi:hypothetical protein
MKTLSLLVLTLAFAAACGGTTTSAHADPCGPVLAYAAALYDARCNLPSDLLAVTVDPTTDRCEAFDHAWDACTADGQCSTDREDVSIERCPSGSKVPVLK